MAATPDYASPYEQHRKILLQAIIPVGRGLAVDVGCNDGTITHLLLHKGYDAVGIDIDPEVIERGRKLYPALDLRHGSDQVAAVLSPRTLTLCLELIEHLTPSAQLALLESIAVATPAGGRIIISTPGRYSAYSMYERLRTPGRRYDWWDASHIGVLSWRRLRRMLIEAGFEVEYLMGYHYLPQRIATPFGSDFGPLARMGFDLIVTAIRR